MAYSDFTLESLRNRFSVVVDTTTGLFTDVPSVPISAMLAQRLSDGLPLATALDTEKARSEFIIAPLLLELWQATNHQVACFSGVEFNVDRRSGLTGYCDYLLSRSPALLALEAPVVALVEAKKEDLNAGVPQCVAEMIAARRFNEQRGHPDRIIYGCVTSGTVWRFLELRGNTATVDLSEVYITDVDKILGVLLYMTRTHENTTP